MTIFPVIFCLILTFFQNAPKFLPAENLNIMTPMQPAQVPPNPYQPSGPIHPPHSMPPSGGMMQPLPTQPPVGGPQGPMLGVQPPPMSQGPMLGVVNQQPGASAPGMMQQTQVPNFKKSNLRYICGMTPKRVTSGGSDLSG